MQSLKEFENSESGLDVKGNFLCINGAKVNSGGQAFQVIFSFREGFSSQDSLEVFQNKAFILSKKNHSENESVIFKNGNLTRKNELWKKTCFECFFALPGKANYFEINFNQFGEWNIYEFEGYRNPSPPKETARFRVESIEVQKKALCFNFFSADFFANQIEFSLCAILKTEVGFHFLSTQHAGEKPDFHLRKSLNIIRRCGKEENDETRN